MESKTYVFGENGPGTGGGLNSILAMLPALMQKQACLPFATARATAMVGVKICSLSCFCLSSWVEVTSLAAVLAAA